MAREFKETAHNKTDLKKFGENWDHIFNKKEEEMSDDKYTSEMARQDSVEICRNLYREKIKELKARLEDA